MWATFTSIYCKNYIDVLEVATNLELALGFPVLRVTQLQDSLIGDGGHSTGLIGFQGLGFRA